MTELLAPVERFWALISDTWPPIQSPPKRMTAEPYSFQK